MWELDYKESWALRNWSFWTVMLEKTLESPLRDQNQSILKEISPGCSLEGLMLKLKPQYFGHLMRRADSFAKTLMLGKIEGGRRQLQRMRWLDASLTQWTWVWVNSRSWWWTGSPGVLQSVVLQRVGHNWVTELRKLWDPPSSKRRCLAVGTALRIEEQIWESLAIVPPERSRGRGQTCHYGYKDAS